MKSPSIGYFISWIFRISINTPPAKLNQVYQWMYWIRLRPSFQIKKRNNNRSPTAVTSLDQLIAAQTQKLDALKTHKNGLMQQLFPSPEEVEA